MLQFEGHRNCYFRPGPAAGNLSYLLLADSFPSSGLGKGQKPPSLVGFCPFFYLPIILHLLYIFLGIVFCNHDAGHVQGWLHNTLAGVAHWDRTARV